jgi:hypothetical protein
MQNPLVRPILIAAILVFAIGLAACATEEDDDTVEQRDASSPLVVELTAVAAQAEAHARHVENVKLNRATLRCGEPLEASLIGDWPIGRSFADGAYPVITVDYWAPGCTEVYAILHVRCADPCTSARALLTDTARPLAEGNGQFTIAHGTVFPTYECTESSEFCRAPGRVGFELCGVSLHFNDPWPATEELDLLRSLEDPEYLSAWDAANPSGRVQFGNSCLADTEGEGEQATTVTATTNESVQPQESEGLVPPSSLSCSVNNGTLTRFEASIGNVYCNGEGVLFCQSSRGRFTCQPNGTLVDGQGTTIRC